MKNSTPTANHATIEGQLKLVPNRYILVRGVSKRVNQILKGANLGPNVDPVLTKDFTGQRLPFGRAIKVALNEVLVGDITIQAPTGDVPEPIAPTHTVVFN